MNCKICSSPISSPVFVSTSKSSITSLCSIIEGNTVVYHCRVCSHLQTDPLPNLDSYYNQDYQFLVSSEEEDQLIVLDDGSSAYRSEHQASILQSKIKLSGNITLLDYGCGKGATLRSLAKLAPGITPYAFDVSKIYKPFWNKFVAPCAQAIKEIPKNWVGHFDLVTSFFALEHATEPRKFTETILSLLKPGGRFYGIVPNVYTNIADMVVADHVNHFSTESLEFLLASVGFSELVIDDASHAGAFVFTGVKSGGKNNFQPVCSKSNIQQVDEIVDYWSQFRSRILKFEENLAENTPVAIFGSGFYGALIYNCLNHPEAVCCFLDSNPHRQRHKLMGLEIIPPDKIPDHVKAVYAGLNPRSAKRIISEIYKDSNLTFFYP